MRRILIFIIVVITIMWSGIYLYATYKIHSFIEHFPEEQVKISYEKLYVKFGIKHPISIIIKNISAKSEEITCNIDLRIYPTFSEVLSKVSLRAIYKQDELLFPMSVTAKRSIHNNFYIATFNIYNARLYINKANVFVTGGVTFTHNKLPLGGYKVFINNVEKLLSSDLFIKYPSILYKVKNILDKMKDYRDSINVDYTENGIMINGTPIENI